MRSVPRWLAVVAVVAVAAVVCAFTVRRALAPAAFVLQLAETTLPADGFTSTELRIHSSNDRELRGLQVQAENSHGAAVESVSVEASSATASLRAGVMSGQTKLRITAPGFTPQEITLQTTLDASDTIGDGTPDFLRLHDPADRASFRRWFTLLAESQYYRGKDLPAEIDDCAALLRFAYREALREHNTAWAHAMSLPAPAAVADVQQYQYPYTPRKRSGKVLQPDAGTAYLWWARSRDAEAGAHLAGEVPCLETPHLGLVPRPYSCSGSPESRHRIRLWEMGGGGKKQGPKAEIYAQVPLLNRQQVVSVWRWLVPAHERWESQAVNIPISDKGVYLIEATDGKLRAYTIIVVSEIAIITKAAPGRLMSFVVDRRSGDPIAGAMLRVWVDQQEAAAKAANQQGLLVISLNQAKPENVAELATSGDQFAINTPGAWN